MSLAYKRALVVGASSGIGLGIATQLAKLQCQVDIASRNMDALNKVIEQLKEKRLSAGGSPANNDTFRAFKIDLTSIRDTDRFVKEYSANVTNLDYLVITAGMMRLGGRKETVEGIDDKMALHYYGRHYLIRQLLPLLEESQKKTGDVRVLSVLAATKGGLVDVNDLGLLTKYSVPNCALACPLYNDCMVESFAKRHSSLSFIHAYPGFVDTPLSNGLPALLKWPLKLFSVFATSIEKCGEFMVSILTSDAFKASSSQSWFLASEHGQPLNKTKIQTEDLCEKVWQHTLQVTDKAISA